MKSTIALVLAVALIADVVVFLGLGFGTGALCVVNCGPPPLHQQTFGNSGLSMYVEVANPNQAAVTDAYSLGSSAMQSTSVSFDLHVFTNGSCGSNGGFGWYVNQGAGGTYGYFVIQMLNGSSAIPFEISNGTMGNGGHMAPGGSLTQLGFGPVFPYYTVSENSSKVSEYCYPSGNGPLSSAQAPAGHVYFSSSFTLNGQYPDHAVLSIAFFSIITNCDGGVSGINGASQPASCNLGNLNNNGFSLTQQVSITGAIGQGYLRSGFSELFPQQGVAFNGGSLLVPYVTGYAGASAYSAQFIEGPCMASPGKVLQTLSVPGSSAGVLKFEVPDGLSRAVSPSTCPAPYTPNTGQVWLFSAWTAQSVIWRQLVDISPSSAPGMPTLTATDQQGNSPAVVGDTLQITMSATYTNASGKIQYFQASAFYNAGESTPPVSSTYWVGANAQGVQLAATCSGGASGTCSATWTFQIGQAAPVTAIIQDITNTSQGNQATIAIQVQIETCPGDPTCGSGPHHANSSLWQELGPWLLAVAIMLAAALGALLAPLPTIGRVLVVAAPAVALAILWGVLSAQFLPGGLLA